MTSNGTWASYSGPEALYLALILLVVAGAWAFWGARLRRPIGFRPTGRYVAVILVILWVLSFLSFVISIVTYMRALESQVPNLNLPTNSVTPITLTCAVVTFLLIAFLSRRYGTMIALGSGVLGAMVAPMIFEFPYDLIVMFRTYPPQPATAYTLLFFLPLFAWEFATFALVTLSPLARVKPSTFFALAGMFAVFGIWAVFGFGYPSTPLFLGLNGFSKILSFVAAATLFLPADIAPQATAEGMPSAG
jgi:hypothetical protein